jgi:O-antigen chain-terminating methyltransferase
MEAGFYRAFEDNFRGSRELIKSRLEFYTSFIDPLRNYYRPALATDIGCGRGEWLELLGEHGFEAQGVDIDNDMLSACRDFGFNVDVREGVDFLQGLPDESQVLVSGFHIAEHLPFARLQMLVREAMRVLKPGGLIILETPNPENLVVGATNFYLDPTHQRPLPPQLLDFLVEYIGFKRNKIIRLQESPALGKSLDISLLDVLSEASPDYAVVGQKEGPREIFESLNPAFDKDYGLSLGTVADRYQQQTKIKAQEIEAIIQEIETKAQHAEAIAQQAEAKAQQAETVARLSDTKAQRAEAKAQHAEAVAKLSDIKAQQAEAIARLSEIRVQQAEAIAQQAEAKAQQAEAAANACFVQLQAINEKASRQVLRWCWIGIVAWLSFAPGSRPRRIIRRGLLFVKTIVLNHPRLKIAAIWILIPFPKLANRLCALGKISTSDENAYDVPITTIPNETIYLPPATIAKETIDLSPHANHIYRRLERAFKTSTGRMS